MTSTSSDTTFVPAGQILITRYSSNVSNGSATYTISMSLPAFIGLVSFFFFSPGWLWFLLFLTFCVWNDGAWGKLKQTWLSYSQRLPQHDTAQDVAQNDFIPSSPQQRADDPVATKHDEDVSPSPAFARNDSSEVDARPVNPT